MKNDTLKFLLIAALVGGGVYFATRGQSITPPAGYSPITLPNGQNAWINTAGTVINAAGSVLGQIDAIIKAIQDAKNKGNGVGRIGCGCNAHRGRTIIISPNQMTTL